VVLDSTPISLLTTTFGPWHISTYMSFKDLQTQVLFRQASRKKGKRDHLNGSDLTHYQQDNCNTM
jgi:hypothetical protein